MNRSTVASFKQRLYLDSAVSQLFLPVTEVDRASFTGFPKRMPHATALPLPHQRSRGRLSSQDRPVWMFLRSSHRQHGNAPNATLSLFAVLNPQGSGPFAGRDLNRSAFGLSPESPPLGSVRI